MTAHDDLIRQANRAARLARSQRRAVNAEILKLQFPIRQRRAPVLNIALGMGDFEAWEGAEIIPFPRTP